MSVKQRFGYDGLGRLTGVTFPGTQVSPSDPTNASITYNLDNLGNRTSVNQVGGSTFPATAQVIGLPKLLQGDHINAAMMVLLSNGQLVGWGNNTTGALANGESGAFTSPFQIPVFDQNTTLPPPGVTIVDWAFINSNLYVVYSDGTVFAAGGNAYGQLGFGDTVARPYLKRIDYFVNQGIIVTGVWAAGSSSLTNGGGCVYFNTSAGLYACGANAAGNLGNASTPTSSVLTPAPCAGVPPTETVTNVVLSAVSGNFSAYVLCASGDLYVAGYNAQGQLGTNSTTNVTGAFVAPYSAPWPGPTFAPIVSVAATGGSSGGSALILDANGYLWGTGYNAYSQIFPATTTARSQFTNLNLGNGVACGIGGGYLGYSYLLESTGVLNIWGDNANNNLFLNNTTSPGFGTAPFLPDAAAQIFFPRCDALSAAQLIVLTASGRLIYAGAANGLNGVNNSQYPGAFYYIAMPASIINRSENVASVFVHGTGATQRLFILTDQGNLYASGDNTSSVCAGGFWGGVTAAPTLNWHHIDFANLLATQ